jgi:ATP-dependent DNA helicase RecQ
LGVNAVPSTATTATDPQVLDVVRRYWGYGELRPLQAEAIRAGIEHRDSLIVLPTGGGKSLCYQVPPIVADRLDVVVSPLISLMKDQVDGLRQNGYPAAAVHSNLTPDERDEIRDGMNTGQYRLLFTSPERLATPRFLGLLKRQGVRAFAIDEAHCISHWGHDFRPEYRRLAALKQQFPGASIHAYTATATTRVQQDIIDQLGLVDPRVLVGRFDRPNLIYRIVPNVDVQGQVFQIIQRHRDEAVIVYCLSRRDTEDLAAFLQANNIKAAAYHAGLEKAERTHTQNAFAAEEIDVVVATVAFGMGIDRSNVRCVIHAAMPKSIEHYQQETGRAGRDGLEAECVLLYSAADAIRWERLFARSAANAEQPEEVIVAQLELLHHMQGLCGTLECRHRALTRYFGQTYEPATCGACDVCLGEIEGLDNATETAQKILSCVYRTDQRFGVGHIVDVLRGADTEPVRSRGHDRLTTYGLMHDMPGRWITNLVYQLVDQGLLERTAGDRPVLRLSEDAVAVLRGEREVRLLEPGGGTLQKTTSATDEWAGVDDGLFQHLRAVRKRIAKERSVPAYVIFDDKTLRELARIRPTTTQTLRGVRGVGEKKRDSLGPTFLAEIESYCVDHALDTDIDALAHPVRPVRTKRPRPNPEKDRAMNMFRQRASLDDIVQVTERRPSTILAYLIEFIEHEQPARIDPWVPDAIYTRVIDAATRLSADRLKPIHDAFDGSVPYEIIRCVLTHHAAREAHHGDAEQ